MAKDIDKNILKNIEDDFWKLTKDTIWNPSPLWSLIRKTYKLARSQGYIEGREEGKREIVEIALKLDETVKDRK